MKASSHEKHSKQQWKKQKKSSDPWARSGRGLAGDMGLNFLFFWFFHGFLQFGQKPREHKKKSSDPWARSGLSTHKPKNQKNQKTKKPKNKKNKKPKKKKNKKNKIAHPKGRGSDAECWVLSFCFFFFFLVFWFFGFLFFWFFGLCVDSHCRCAKQRLPGTVSGCTRGRAGKNQKTKKTKKPKNQKTKKPKNQKKKKNKIAHPKGRGSDAECWVLSFCFFCFFWFFWFFVFLFFWFFGFLVCVWIAIADVPSRDCQALSVVALEARSIHYSTAMFAMT